jgi:hypothetical protein
MLLIQAAIKIVLELVSGQTKLRIYRLVFVRGAGVTVEPLFILTSFCPSFFLERGGNSTFSPPRCFGVSQYHSIDFRIISPLIKDPGFAKGIV